tara:strand:+ start:766 stop:918 length:153 start_codon:yes stop_codon:yes gene_type:complete
MNAIKIAKNNAQRLDEWADMNLRSIVRTSNIPLQTKMIPVVKGYTVDLLI